MTRYQLEIFEYSHYAQKSFTYVAEALTPLLSLGTFSWIVTCDSHQKILNSEPRSRPTRQRSAAHQWAAAHRLRTAAIVDALLNWEPVEYIPHVVCDMAKPRHTTNHASSRPQDTTPFNLLCHMPFSSILDDEIQPLPLLSTLQLKNISTLHLFFQPPFSFNPTSYFNLPPPKYLAPHLHLDNSITAIHTTQTPRLPYSRAMRPKFLLSHGIVKQKQPLD